MRFLSKRHPATELTYAALKRETDRFAGVLDALGVRRGERVFVLAGRIPELYVAALGTLKHGAVFCPLFSAFGPEPIEQRLRLGDARVLVTTTALYGRKVAELRGRLPGLEHVLLVGEPEEIAAIPQVEDFRALMDGCSRIPTRSPRPPPRTWRCFTSRAVRPGRRRARFTCTRRWSRIARPGGRCSICVRGTCSGARPIPAG